MTAANYSHVSRAIYKGAEIILNTSTITGGRKTVKRQFPNTDVQSVEDLGRVTKSYSLDCTIALVGEESDYNRKRDNILKVLDSPGPGKLVHPFYGVIENSVVDNYNFVEEMTSLGIGSLTINFIISDTDGTPKEDVVTQSQVLSKYKSVSSKAYDKIVEDYDPEPSLLGVYKAAKQKVSDVSDAISGSVKFAQKTTKNINSLANEISNFQNNIATLAGTPIKLAAAITNVFSTINATVATAGAAIETFKQFFGFGFFTDITLQFDTLANRKRKKNSDAVNYAINAIALSAAYHAASNSIYKTVDDVDNMLGLLESQFELIRANTASDNDLFNELKSAREIIIKFLESEKQRASKILVVDSEGMSARALSYFYYGDDSQAIDIANLNGGIGLIYPVSAKVFTN